MLKIGEETDSSPTVKTASFWAWTGAAVNAAAKSMQATPAVAFNRLFNRFFIFRLILSQAVIRSLTRNGHVVGVAFFDTGRGHAHELRALQRGNVRAPQ